MNYFRIIVLLLSFIACAIGVMMIFDARKLSKKWFGFGDQNEGAKTVKLSGFALTIIGALIIFFTI